MEAVLRRYRRGLLKTLAGSFIFHALLIAVALIFFNAEPRRVFFTPITVSIVGQAGPPKEPAPAKAEPSVSMPPVKGERPAIKPEIKEEKPQAKGETARLKKALKTSKRLSPVEEALRHIAADVKEKDDGSLIGSSIEKLKRKHEAEKKALSRGLEEIKKELFSKSTVSNAAKPAPAAQSGVAGGTAGGVAGGVAGGISDVKYASYYNLISGMVQQEWAVYFDEFKNIGTEIIVSIKIAGSGSLMEVRVEKSSGNLKFDESLLNAVKKASPFPPLPKDFEEKHMDVSFRFCPDCEGKR